MIAILLAAIAAAITILRPLDILGWSLQSKLFEHRASSEIVFVTDVSGGVERSDRDFNRQLLSALEQLDTQGAETIVIDTPIRSSGSVSDDRRLREALQRMSERVVLTRMVRDDPEENAPTDRNTPFFEDGQRVASTDLVVDFLGFVWKIDPSHSDGQSDYDSVWNLISGDGTVKHAVYPDYSIKLSTIPTADLAALSRGKSETLGDVSGKTVVIGGLDRDPRAIKAPDNTYGTVPASLVHILAAETANRGTGQLIGVGTTLPVFGLALVLGLLFFQSPRARKWFYFIWIAAFAVTFFLAAKFGIRLLLVDPLLIGVVYGGLRASLNFKRRHLYVEQRSKLPNFVALQRDIGDIERGEKHAIIVAKVARLDAIFATISQADQGRYLRQLAARLTVGDDRTNIYYDGGKYLAFVLPKADYQDLQSHLEGLRAIASQAITVSQRVLDVSMTIGVDNSNDNSIANRLSSAIAAADQAREAYRPVFIISDFETDSEAWDYSLQARLEDALSENRISIKLQPQVDLKSGLIVGAEALARWADEERGEIPPAQFILQCERVGRLDELTKRILYKSLSASRELEREGLVSRISVNVSAIQFVDTRIADLIERSLLETGANPESILIEVTESARIEDFGVARAIMERIGRIGVRFSIDDFGVASANIDALYQLPFQEMKIDRMFVKDICDWTSASAIVSNLIHLARDVGLTSVAEGIENRETFEKLKELGCDLAQGYYLARPQPLPQLTETLRLQRDKFTKGREYG